MRSVDGDPDERHGALDSAQTRIVDPTGAPAPRGGEGAANASERYEVGERIGDRYEVLAVHRGGMGVVYGTLDHKTRNAVALKTLQARFSANVQMQKLFATEAAIWVRLEKHPYIARAFMVEVFDEMPYVVTQYVSGGEGKGSDLRSWLGSPELTLPVGVGFASQIAQGMRHAVEKVPGLVHRDLKPANVLVDERWVVKVTDFGLVAAMAGDAGTPAYMAPEQWRREALDLRTDIYAYGCILYEIFTGHHLFAARTVEELRSAHLQQRPIPPRALNPRLSEELERLVLRCLEKSPGARPSSWDEVVSECEHEFLRLTGRRLEPHGDATKLDAAELLNASSSLSHLGRHAEAVELCDRALALDCGDASLVVDLLLNKGLAFRGLGRNEDAIGVFEDTERRYRRALELPVREGVAKALIGKGNVLGKLGRHEDAVRAHQEVITRFEHLPQPEIQARVAQALYNQSVQLALVGRSLDAIRTCEEILRRFQDAPELAIREIFVKALSRKGAELEALGRKREALRALDDLIERFGSAPELAIRVEVASTLCAKGALLGDLGQREEEDRAYREVVTRFGAATAGALRDCVGIAMFNRAVRAGEQGRSEDELRQYQEIVARFGDSHELALRMHVATALANLAIRLSQCGREDDALHTYDEIVTRFASAPELPLHERVAGALFGKARQLAARGRVEEAVKTFIEVVRRYEAVRDPGIAREVARSLLHAGLLMDRLGHPEHAAHAYRDFVARVVPRCERCGGNDLTCNRLGGAGVSVSCRKCNAEYRFTV